MSVSDPVRILVWNEVLQKYVDVSEIYPLPVSGAGGGGEVITTPGDTAALDAFGRQRSSGQGFRADAMFTYDKLPLLFNEVASGTGAATHDGNLRSVWLSTGGLVSGAVMRFALQSYTPYSPGNSQQVIVTGTMNPDDVDFTNVVAEIGYGDTANGVGFRYDENGAHVFLRSSISGAPADLEVVDEANWSWPDHGGVAPFTVDWTKSQIFFIDFQSLAVGRIRFYLDHNGLPYKVHEITNDNLRTGPYWQLASLPPYWSVENTGTALAVARVLAICVTVKSEGSPDQADLPGFVFTASRAEDLLTVSTTLIPVLSVRLLSTFKTFANRGLMIPLDLQIQADNPVYWVLIKNASLTNPSWNAVDTESICEFDIDATAVTGGRQIVSGYGGGANNRAAGSDHGVGGRGEFSVNAAGVSDILTLAMIRTSTSDADVGASLNFKEIR